VGTNVLSVGYGRTTLIATGAGTENTIRRRVAKTLSQVSQQQIAYDMQSNGICQGDSGGPVLVTIGGVEQVAGVHSYVQGDCNGTGVSCRVSFEASFVSGELAKAVPADSCDLCGQVAESGNGACAAATRSCLADPACKGYYECLSAGGTAAACVLKFPKAEGPFNAAANCQCTKACVTQCKGTYACNHTPKCGYKLPAGTCATCTEAACCDEALACSADGTCYVCLKTNDAAAECATNAARKKMATCVASKCSAECAGSGLAAGADPPPADPAPGDVPAAPTPTTTTTTTGCAVAATERGRGGSGALFAGIAALALAARRRRRRAPHAAELR
jgi:MYXO-CTERM domain-containing protein